MNPIGSELEVFVILFDTDKGTVQVLAGYASRSATHRKVEHGLAFVGVGLD